MNRSTRTIVVFLLSLAVAGIASALVYQAAQGAPPAVAEVTSYPVAVAARALPVGSRLGLEDVKLVAWPAASPIKGSVSRLEDAVNRGLLASVVENEPLTSAKLASAESGAGLPPMITAGMRAISVHVDEVVGVAGFAVPGAHVDVVVTINSRDESVSRVVVSNVQVLAAGTRTDQNPQPNAKATPSTVVTLLVTPADAERISLASSIGRMMLTLRHPLDQSTSDTTGTRVASLLGAPEAPPPSASAPRPVSVARAPKPVPVEPPPPPPPPYTVETIRAAKRTAEVVK